MKSHRLETAAADRWTPAGKREALRRAPAGLVLVFLAIALLSCKTSTAPPGGDGLSIHLDAVPLLLKAADPLDAATVWATVLDSGRPVSDSTRVSFAATNGEIEAEAFTRDGLARVEFLPGAATGVAAVIAQVRAVRDTVLITLY